MITGNINNSQHVKRLHPCLQRGLTAVQQLLSDGKDDGKYAIEGDQLFVMLMTIDSKDAEQCRPEFHAKYSDIQVCLEGHEYLGFSNQERSESVSEDKLEAHDVAFTDTINDERFVELKGGDFAVFFDNEMHRPGCHFDKQGKQIRKAVVKIHQDLFI
ncbi:DUF386 domain-containing protein [Alginatibacterium sediminis]|uniref:DUF386 domain-containing protein n=1 Tax=Alginatibacterium sediminis TaxID=2164068 RepID=A0A420ED98_9ALTE|nr:YhcH/YjgK/YiaL family protein [Alginatibacterium sediminis]RKF18643.1 DUF386 domain-containing protein [Alginatibacterium sediminis]